METLPLHENRAGQFTYLTDARKMIETSMYPKGVKHRVVKTVTYRASKHDYSFTPYLCYTVVMERGQP